MTNKPHHEDSMLEIVSTLETIAVGQSGYLDRLCKLKVLVLYHVKLEDGRVQRRHIDQLRSRLPDSEDATLSSDTEPDSGPQL